MPTTWKFYLKGKPNLEERFADIDIKQARLKLKAEAEQLKKYPRGMGVIFKMPDLPGQLKPSQDNLEKEAQLWLIQPNFVLIGNIYRGSAKARGD